jgi:hypothetical protein
MENIDSGKIPLEPIYLQMGDLVMRYVIGIHRGTANLTSEARPVAVVGYVRENVKTDHVDLKIPKTSFNAYPKDLQSLLRCTPVDGLEEDKMTERYINFEM